MFGYRLGLTSNRTYIKSYVIIIDVYIVSGSWTQYGHKVKMSHTPKRVTH